MITSTRLVLATTSQPNLNVFTKHEAITLIDDVKKSEQVWRNNKTPIMLSDEQIPDTLQVPFFEGDVTEISEQFIEFCHANGIESGEYISGIKYDSNKERCILCELASCKGMNGDMAFYNRNVTRPVDCIIYDSRYFYVVPELGALKLGFLMIVPKEHYLSVAQYPPALLKEYQQVCEDLEEILKNTFGAKIVTFFEHGTAPGGYTSHKKSIVHAHTHVVTDFVMEDKYKEMVQLKTIDDINVAAHTHYFSYQEGAHGDLQIAMDSEVYVQRQFPRQVMALQLGLAPGQYNWRHAAFHENSAATVYRLYTYLKTLQPKNGRLFERTRDFVIGYSQRDDVI